MKTLSDEDVKRGWITIEEKEWFEKFYDSISGCRGCRSPSCIVFGGWKNPCFVDNKNEEYLKTKTK